MYQFVFFFQLQAHLLHMNMHLYAEIHSIGAKKCWCNYHDSQISRDGHLRIQDTEMNDAGLYTCIATNGFGSININYTVIVLGMFNRASCWFFNGLFIFLSVVFLCVHFSSVIHFQSFLNVLCSLCSCSVSLKLWTGFSFVTKPMRVLKHSIVLEGERERTLWWLFCQTLNGGKQGGRSAMEIIVMPIPLVKLGLLLGHKQRDRTGSCS